MELLEYQKLSRIPWRALAERVGVPHSNLNALAHGKRDCSMETARLIEDATGGAVTANDINKARRRYIAAMGRPAVEADA